MVTGETVWIVDYDLPQDCPSARRQFYREVQRYLKDHGIASSEAGWSTQSVVVTQDKGFAEFVHAKGSQLGRANLYEARRLR